MASQTSIDGVVVFVDEAHDIPIDIAIVRAGKVAIFVVRIASGIPGIGASEGNLVANTGKLNTCPVSVFCPSYSSVSAVFNVIYRWGIRTFREGYSGACRLGLESQRTGEV